jgi:hypothetical protein
MAQPCSPCFPCSATSPQSRVASCLLTYFPITLVGTPQSCYLKACKLSTTRMGASWLQKYKVAVDVSRIARIEHGRA